MNEKHMPAFSSYTERLPPPSNTALPCATPFCRWRIKLQQCACLLLLGTVPFRSVPFRVKSRIPPTHCSTVLVPEVRSVTAGTTALLEQGYTLLYPFLMSINLLPPPNRKPPTAPFYWVPLHCKCRLTMTTHI